MGQKVTTPEEVDRKAIEYQIFDKSFALIDKYSKPESKGLRDAFNREYEWVLINEDDGDLNWHKIMPKQMRTCNGLSYIHAIQTIGAMLKEAEELSTHSDYRFADKPKFREIYRLVDQLIDLRDKEQEPEVQCLCWTVRKGYDYENHEYVMKAWDDFRRDHD